MSSTTEDKTPESSPAFSKNNIDKKKIKVLKAALKDERNSKLATEHELKQAFSKIEQQVKDL
jgi:hypothetical protein